MPKVETSTLKRGDTNRLASPQSNDDKKCVSNCFGNYYGEIGYVFNKSRFGLKKLNEIQYRFRRDLDEPNLDVDDSLPKRRVVKKLIRIQPIYNQTLELNNSSKNSFSSTENSLSSSSEEDYSASSTASRKHYRKRVVIKKRRKKRPKQQRTVVVTKKRLLTKTLIHEPSPSTTVDLQTSSKVAKLEITSSTMHGDAKSLPYEPFLTELSQPLDSPLILLKTTVITSTEYETKTLVQSRLRTYTFVVTRVSGDEQFVTSTTEVKPQTKTLTVTLPRTRLTTLTLLDLEATETLPFLPLTVDSSSLGTTTQHYTDTQEYDTRIFEEARYNNLATRVMSNGVEVIVAGDKSTLPGEPDIKRVLPSSIYKPITLKPSTLSDHMMMLLPQDASNVESLSSSLHPNQFVTKTCLTTFTYLTTYLENGSTTVSSHEQVVSNIATEERNSAKIVPTPSTGITLTQHPNLAVGIFMTTYTYLNTILDGEQPLVVTSKHTVTNTVTAPDDYLSLLQPPKKASAVKDTNTYFSTVSLQKTLYEGQKSQVISTNEVVTQVVITESVPPKATSVMTSYIALDFEDNGHSALSEYTTTDVVKTYYVTYTYFNTFLENGQTIIKTNVSTSSDVVTEKLFLHPKRTHANSVINTSPIVKDKKKNKIKAPVENLEVHATKTYVTTFTYLTTLLQENNHKDATSTVISSHTREVENVVTETIDVNLLDQIYLHSLRGELKDGASTVIELATLQNGQILEVTAFNKDIKPTKVLPIEKTQMVETKISPPVIESSNPNVVTGSTIIFFDDIDQVEHSTKKPTPSLTSKAKITKTAAKNNLGSLLSSEIVKKSQVIADKQTSKTQSKRHTNKQTRAPIAASKPTTRRVTPTRTRNKTAALTADPAKKKTGGKIEKPEIPDLLGLGSINMNTLHALKPVINAMAGLIQTNLKNTRRNDTVATTPDPNFDTVAYTENDKVTSEVVPAGDRSPIYIPLGAQEEGLEIAESQNVATIHINEWEEDRPHKDQVVVGKPTHESPLLNGGIPISPGQVITANSDVIVGKPGRIGPRIPSIPLHKDHLDEIPIDMKPPPILHKTWPKRHNDKFTESLPKKETPADYFGPPPPPPTPPRIPLRPPNFVRGEKHKTLDRKRIPVPQPGYAPNRIPINFVEQDNRASPQQIAPLHIPLEAPTIILTRPHDINIQPSILNEPIVLPEVIERSTGQPLLINLQPSQVAFINIPHNRTTALIYGGSTEPHRNGQYFDDPSPYPEPEFSGIENFNNGVAQYASVYDDGQPPNQKQVGGVIKVATNVINNNPPSSANPAQIRPSKPISNNIVPLQNNININPPPISFGMVHHGNDFNAHIINHGDIRFSPPPASYDVVPNLDEQNVIYAHQQPIPISIMHDHQNEGVNRPGQVIRPHRPNIFEQSHRMRPKPNLELMEYLTPPQVTKYQQRPIELGQEQYQPRPHIPIGVNVPVHTRPEIIGVETEYSNQKPLPIPLTPHRYNVPTRAPQRRPEFDQDAHDEDDMTNEAGEVVQESNPRPLRPGQVPKEVLRLTTRQPLGDFKNNSIRFPDSHNVNFGIKVAGHDNEVTYHRPIIQEPRPFEIGPVVRPENQQTNQINQHEYSLFVNRPNRPLESHQNNLHDHIYEYATSAVTSKPSQYYYDGIQNVNITFGQKIPNLSDPYYPTKDVLEPSGGKHQILYTTSIPLKELTTAPNQKYYDHTVGSVEIVPIEANLIPKRPYITSMPVNPPVITHRPLVNIYEYAHNFGSQTEKPFNVSLANKPQNTNHVNETYSFNNDDVIPTPYVDTLSTRLDLPTTKASTEEVDPIFQPPTINVTAYDYDMEIMKPPPPPEPATSMEPPKIEVHSPGGGIHRVPNLNINRPAYDLEGQASSPAPYVPDAINDEEVMGLSPPPPVTTHRPILKFKPNVTTHQPIFSLEIEPLRTQRPMHPYTFETPASSISTTPTRRRRPFTRRRTTTTTTTHKPIITRYNWQKPVTPIDISVFKDKSTTTTPPRQELSESEHKQTSIAPSVTTSVQTQPTLEVIIGNPDLDVDVKHTSDGEIISSSTVQISELPSSDTPFLEPTGTYSTHTIDVVPTHAPNFTTGVHHAGNEVKVVDDSSTTTSISSVTLSKKPTPTTSVYKETKVIIPTRYITHTKTSTVTITKTTVVKTMGGPASTMTILVTKTEKSTIVDTVTEIHTLVKPTSIVETVTTTINQLPSTLYPPDVPYGSTYSSYPPIMPTPTLEPSMVPTTSSIPAEDDLEEFIIHDTDPPPESKPNASIHIPTDNDSIFVVMTDKKHGEIVKIPEKVEEESYETQSRDEVPAGNEVNHVLLGGILIASPPSLETPARQDRCSPECKASKNELCQKVEGIMRCVCRPGFARMFPDRPCKPTYTYSIKLGLERYGKEKLEFEEALADSNSPEFNRLATITHEALDRMVMQSDLRDIYHGVHVHSYEPVLDDKGVINTFYLQLSDNTDDQRLKEIFKKYLRNNNYSLGGTELYASKDFLDNLAAEDFDECANPQFHDCSEHAHCFNLPGTYTCSCKEGYSDLSENTLYPGRICSAELIGCEHCHYHGTCYSKGDDQIICECFQWYAGENCHINLKVLLIALVTLGALLFALLLICIILTCTRRKPRSAGLANGMSFMPQRLAAHNARRTTLDRRAMIQDTSSEGSQSDTNTLPYVAKQKLKKPPKGALKKTTINLDVENGSTILSFGDQKDRSLPVMIPRAKYHPAPPTSPLLNMESFAKRKASGSSNETKLLSYLDAGPSPSKVDPKRKYTKAPNDSFRHDKGLCRKISGGALVSAGFEVSATVGGTVGTLLTTCGTEADRSENATLIQKISADLLSSTGTRSQFTTFRKSLVDNDINDPLSNWLDIPPKVTATVSEARSYDETTIQPPTKSYRNGYDSKSSSQHQNDEANTMAERDVGSTFLLPHTHLYKPDRGSDISGFDSL